MRIELVQYEISPIRMQKLAFVTTHGFFD